MRRLFQIAATSLLAVAGVVLVLWLIGGRTYLNKVAVTIDAPPDAVFEHLIEPNHLKSWMHGLVEIEPLTEGGHRVGAKARIVLEEDGTRYELQDEVLRSERGRLLKTQSTGPLFDVTNTYELTQSGDATQLRHTMRANYKSWARLFAAFLGGAIQRQLEADLARLKTVVENG